MTLRTDEGRGEVVYQAALSVWGLYVCPHEPSWAKCRTVLLVTSNTETGPKVTLNPKP